MSGYKHLKAADFAWAKSETGLETVRFEGDGVIMSVVKGKKGDIGKEHSHSEGSYMYVVQGKIEVDNQILEVGDAGYCHNGGQYGCRFLEDSTFVVCRSSSDEITTKD